MVEGGQTAPRRQPEALVLPSSLPPGLSSTESRDFQLGLPACGKFGQNVLRLGDLDKTQMDGTTGDDGVSPDHRRLLSLQTKPGLNFFQTFSCFHFCIFS